MSAERLPNESPEYRKLRAELLQAEIELRDQRERVAELRRRLPRDTEVEDYVFREVAGALQGPDAPVRDVRLSELFERPEQPLILVQFMYGEAQTEPCPMCTSFADGYDAALPHIEQRANFGVVVSGDVVEFRKFGRGRGWRNLRLLSSGGTSFRRDFKLAEDDGRQHPGVSVFTLGADGRPRHFYTADAMLAGHFRGMDLLSPVWHFLDLLPDGRSDFWPGLRY